MEKGRVNGMDYDTPIRSVEHAQWCLTEAAKRYDGKIVWNEDNFPLVEYANGVCHTDQVLRAVGANWSSIAKPSEA